MIKLLRILNDVKNLWLFISKCN